MLRKAYTHCILKFISNEKTCTKTQIFPRMQSRNERFYLVPTSNVTAIVTKITRIFRKRFRTLYYSFRNPRGLYQQ